MSFQRPPRVIVRLSRNREPSSVQSPWFVLIVVAAIGAVGPLTAAVIGHFDQAFKTRVAFLDRAIDPQRSREDRREVLRFLVATEPDGPTKKWANIELTTVQNELDALKKDYDELKKKLGESDRDRVAEHARLSAAEKALAAKGHTAAENRKLREEANTARADEYSALTKEKDALTELLEMKQKNAPPGSIASPVLLTPSTTNTSLLTITGSSPSLSLIDPRGTSYLQVGAGGGINPFPSVLDPPTKPLTGLVQIPSLSSP